MENQLDHTKGQKRSKAAYSRAHSHLGMKYVQLNKFRLVPHAATCLRVYVGKQKGMFFYQCWLCVPQRLSPCVADTTRQMLCSDFQPQPSQACPMALHCSARAHQPGPWSRIVGNYWAGASSSVQQCSTGQLLLITGWLHAAAVQVSLCCGCQHPPYKGYHIWYLKYSLLLCLPCSDVKCGIRKRKTKHAFKRGSKNIASQPRTILSMQSQWNAHIGYFRVVFLS